MFLMRAPGVSFFFFLNDLLHYLHDPLHLGGLGDHLIDLVLPGVLDVDLLRVSGCGDDVGLFHLLVVKELSYLERGFGSIHNWHALIHKDEAVSYSFLSSFLNAIISLKTVIASVDEVHNVLLFNSKVL